jgi:hypothetical protein
MPKRIQRKRTKGWKMPDGAVYVGRPTIWGNPLCFWKSPTSVRWWENERKRTMSSLRPECIDAKDGETALSNDTALFLIRDAVARRRSLIYGRLRDGAGHHCALGAFWADNPKAILNSSLIEEVAAVNDSIPKTASGHKRWKKVHSWLRFKLASLARQRAGTGA